MKTFKKTIFMTLIGAPILVGCHAQTRPTNATLSRSASTQTSEKMASSEANIHRESGNLEVFKSWFSGRFDNYLQVLDDEFRKVEHVHERVHSIFHPVRLPWLGQHVFYVEQYGENDPKKVYRQRLYFVEEIEDGKIKLSMASFREPALVLGAHLNPDKLAKVQKSDLIFKTGCDVTWQFQGDKFVGQTKRGACRIKSKRFGEMRIEDDLTLTKDSIWIRDRATTPTGQRIFGHPGGIPHKLKKARSFTGWAAVKTDNGRWIRSQDISTHDQGGRAQLWDKEGQKLPYEVSLAQRVYTKTKTAILKFAVHRVGEKKSMAYIWASPSSERVGLNLGQFQSGLTRRTETERKKSLKKLFKKQTKDKK